MQATVPKVVNAYDYKILLDGLGGIAACIYKKKGYSPKFRHGYNGSLIFRWEDRNRLFFGDSMSLYALNFNYDPDRWIEKMILTSKY